MKQKLHTGFTLIEILVATAIFVIVIGMVYTIFMGTLGYWKRGYGLASRQQAARTLFSRMTSNISSLFFSVSRSIYCFGSKEKLYFISASTKSSGGDLAEMGYEFIPSDNTIVFSYQEKADFDFDTFDSKNIIAVKIISLTFSYLDREGNWLDDWDSRIGGQQEKLPPQAIKINFAIENTDYPDNKEVFETVVELPIRSKYQ
ncbi:type II secretion system protein J [Candidatus Omnitrophota bacterium]